MLNCFNRTGKDDPWCQQIDILFCVVSVALGLSLILNIVCCVSKCYQAGKMRYRSRGRQGSHQSLQQMAENPIYGNLNYTHPTADPASSLLGSSSLKDQKGVDSDSQYKSQDCYANLTLKAPRQQSGSSSPHIKYSVVVHLEEPERTDEENTPTVPSVSDLYASVQTQRTKTITTAASGEDYANHL
ncbi:uncharacterized protein ACBR49_016474 [Aulostomus maculatus]